MPIRSAVSLCAALLLAACGGVPGTVHVNTAAVAELNPGPNGVAFPAQVRLFQLRDAGKFSNADYFQLAEHEKAVLGDDLVQRDEFILHPQESRTIDLATKPETRFVGVTVAYRHIDAAKWRAITPVSSPLQLTLRADQVTLGPR